MAVIVLLCECETSFYIVTVEHLAVQFIVVTGGLPIVGVSLNVDAENP